VGGVLQFVEELLGFGFPGSVRDAGFTGASDQESKIAADLPIAPTLYKDSANVTAAYTLRLRSS
jgi:hypothetical protein